MNLTMDECEVLAILCAEKQRRGTDGYRSRDGVRVDLADLQAKLEAEGSEPAEPESDPPAIMGA